MTTSPVIPALQSALPTFGGLWRRRGDGPSASIVASSPSHSSFQLLSDTFKYSELVFATRAMRKSLNQGRLPSGLPFYLRSACRAQSTPALRTHALLSRIRYAPLQGADSCPKASSGPLPQILASRRGSGSRRHTRWASRYRNQRTN